MGEITDFVELYIADSDILAKKTFEIARALQNNIKKEAPYKRSSTSWGLCPDGYTPT